MTSTVSQHVFVPSTGPHGATTCLTCGHDPHNRIHEPFRVLPALPDTGARTTFGEGMASREADPNKPQYVGISPWALKRLALLFTKGGIKYKDTPGGFRNWEAGMPITRYINAILGHTLLYLARDETEDHAAAIVWNAQCIIHHEEVGTTSGKTFADIDDRPTYPASKK